MLLATAGCNSILGLAEPQIVGPDAGSPSPDATADAKTPARDGARDRSVPGDALDARVADTSRPGDAGPVDAAFDVRHDAATDAPPDSATGVAACTGGAGAPTSCLASGAGLSNCGVSGQDCCCSSLEVPGGTYERDYPNSASSAPAANPATISSFRLDKYEVTVGRFRTYIEFLTSLGGESPASASGKHVHLNEGNGLLSVGASSPDGGPDSGLVFETGWDSTWNTNLPTGTGTASAWDTQLTTACTGAAFATWTDAPGANENLPINCLSWYAAYAFCIWDGGFLPSEAEWEYAAAGGGEQRNYAWGTTSPGLASAYAIYNCDYPGGLGLCADGGVTNLAPVGIAPSGVARWGHLDIGGNVWEFTLDSFADYVVPCIDCVNETAQQFRIERGGSFTDTAAALVPPFRGYGFSSAFDENGMRCARTP